MAQYAYVAHVVGERGYGYITGDARNVDTEAEIIPLMLADFARERGVSPADLVVTDFSAMRTGE